MDPHLLDDFAARSVGVTLAELTRKQRMPASGRAIRPPRTRRGRSSLRRRSTPGRRQPTTRRPARLTTAIGGAALVGLPSVVVISQMLR